MVTPLHKIPEPQAKAVALVRDAQGRPVIGHHVKYLPGDIRAAIAAMLTPEEYDEYREYLE